MSCASKPPSSGSRAERFPALSTEERERCADGSSRTCASGSSRTRNLTNSVLYPEPATRLGDPLDRRFDRTTTTSAIRRWIELIAAADVTDTAHLQQLLYGLDALIRVHLWKENEFFLASLESSSWPALAG